MPTTYTTASTLRGAIHQSTTAGEFMVTGAGDSSYQSQMTGLLNTGVEADQRELTNHIGRAFYRKLNQLSLTATYKDQLDAGFRPLTFTGLYKAPSFDFDKRNLLLQ